METWVLVSPVEQEVALEGGNPEEGVEARFDIEGEEKE